MFMVAGHIGIWSDTYPYRLDVSLIGRKSFIFSDHYSKLVCLASAGKRHLPTPEGRGSGPREVAPDRRVDSHYNIRDLAGWLPTGVILRARDALLYAHLDQFRRCYQLRQVVQDGLSLRV